jgi:2-oxoglutarate/2-oxoacid ferredoxin oxidoreductase subunit beta
MRAPIESEGAPGSVETITLHDGGTIRLRRLDEGYDPRDKAAVMAHLEAHRLKGEVVTGLLYVDDREFDLHDAQNTIEVPLNTLSDRELVPGQTALAKVNASLR